MCVRKLSDCRPGRGTVSGGHYVMYPVPVVAMMGCLMAFFLVTTVSGSSQNLQSESKCYGDSSYIWNLFNLTCSEGVISIVRIRAMVNPIEDDCPMRMHQSFQGNKTVCCHYQAGDCGDDYTEPDYYAHCNGRRSCPGQPTGWMYTPDVCKNDTIDYPEFTQFMIIDYDCVPVTDCDAINVTDGEVKGNTTIGSTVSITCMPGFTLSGAGNLTCGTDGVWIDYLPSCEKDCPPINVTHAEVTGDVTFGYTVTVTCLSGLTISGEETLVCGSGGVWSHEIPTCEEDCPPINVTQAEVTGDRTFGSTGTVICWSDLTINGEETLVCGSGGVWSNEIPTCEEDCPPINVTHAEVTGDRTFGSTVTVTCWSEWRINGEETLVCGSGGVWSPAIPTCEEVSGSSQNLQSESKCYGDSSYIWNLFNLTCSEGVISIVRIRAMVNPIEDDCPIRMHQSFQGNKTVCCQYQAGDCGDDYINPETDYEICNGRRSCPGLQASWKRTPDVCKNGTIQYPEFTQFMIIDYDCVPVTDCDAINVTDGEVKGNTTIGSTVSVTCMPGFALSGAGDLTCGTDGVWNHYPPSCEKDCQPINVTHADVTGERTFGSTVTVACWSELTINGEETLVCGSGGVWSHEIPTCEEDCPPINVTHAAEVTGYMTIGSTVTVTCLSGLTINGEETLVCGSGGVWSHEIPTCEEDCPPINVTHAAEVTGYMTIGSTVTVTCLSGLTINGEEILVCGSGGVWSHEIPTCEEDCPLINVTHAAEVTGYMTVGSTVTVTCLSEFTINGEETLVCGSGGGWSHEIPTCEEGGGWRPEVPTCEEDCLPINVTHAHVTGDMTFGSTVTVTCLTEFTINGEEMLVCGSGGVWSHKIPTCEEDCPPINVTHAAEVTGYMTIGSTVTVTCLSGLTINGEETLVCGSGGVWSHEIPTCEEDCPPINVTHAEVTADRTFGSTVTVTCLSEFTINGEETLVCGSGGVWSHEIPTCEEDCSSINVTHAEVTRDMTFGSTVTVSCLSGLTINGEETLVCGSGGVWSHKIPTCEEDCPPITVPQADVTGDRTFGSTVTVTCLTEFAINGKETLVCGSGGVWSREIPTCDKELDGCRAVSIPQANVTYTGNRAVGSVVTVTCWPGFLMNGSASLVCGAAGVWDSAIPTCEKDGEPTSSESEGSGLNLIFVVIPLILILILLGIIAACCIYKKKRKIREVQPHKQDKQETADMLKLDVENATQDTGHDGLDSNTDRQDADVELKGVTVQLSREELYGRTLDTPLVVPVEVLAPLPNTVTDDQTVSHHVDTPIHEYSTLVESTIADTAPLTADTAALTAAHVTTADIIINESETTTDRERRKRRRRKRKEKFLKALAHASTRQSPIEMEPTHGTTPLPETMVPNDRLADPVPSSTEVTRPVSPINFVAPASSSATMDNSIPMTERHRPVMANENMPTSGDNTAHTSDISARPKSATYYWRNNLDQK